MFEFSASKMQILLVEDDLIFCEYVNYVFIDIDADIAVANNLADARKQLKDKSIDIVLLDNCLPDGRGVELMNDITKLNDKPTTMMITAEEGHEVIKQAFEMGVRDYMVKPIQVDLFLHKITSLYQNLLNERQLAQTNAEMLKAQQTAKAEEKLAQYVYSSLVGNSDETLDGMHKFQLSHSDFCGDFLFSLQATNGNRYVFLADAMGHGLAAAICILPVISIAKAMANKNMPLLNIVHEVNEKLEVDLPDDRFVALGALELNFNSNEVIVINSGLPSLLFHMKNDEVREVKSSSPPLGAFEAIEFSVTPISLALDDVQQILMFTDGLCDQRNLQGETLELSGIIKIAKNLVANKASWIQIEKIFNQHRSNQEKDDDVTLCVIKPSALKSHYQKPVDETAAKLHGTLKFNLSATGDYLRVLDVIRFTTTLLTETRIDPRFSSQIFTVFAELYNNALDHGVLNLDSALKNDVMGFAEFLSEREEALNNLSLNDSIDVNIHLKDTDFIEINVKDSGAGFDHQNTKASKDLSGRGLALLSEITSQLERNEAGNQVKAIMKQQGAI